MPRDDGDYPGGDKHYDSVSVANNMDVGGTYNPLFANNPLIAFAVFLFVWLWRKNIRRVEKEWKGK